MKKMILICCVILLLTSGCMYQHEGPIHQSLENVEKIELLDTANGEETVLYTLADNEVEAFWKEFSQLRFRRYFNDPATQFGRYAVRITYQNRYVDVIGMDICTYRDPSGKRQKGSGWYYAADKEAFVQLLLQYIP